MKVREMQMLICGIQIYLRTLYKKAFILEMLLLSRIANIEAMKQAFG